MRARLLCLIVASLCLIGATAPAKSVRVGQQVSWTMDQGTKRYAQGDLTATFDRVQCAPLGEECEAEQFEPRLTITSADGHSVTIEGSPMQNILMLGPLGKGGPVAAFFQSYTGGMHCCYAMQAVVRVGGKLTQVDLGAYDGTEIGWPKDLDGDGNLDFVVTDDRFLYAFESYAASIAPPKVLNVIDGKVVDVSTDPRFAGVFRKAAASAGKSCRKDTSPNGACAAYAAAAARAGQLDAAWPVILDSYDKKLTIWPDACKVARDADDNCPDGQLIEYPDYPTALRAYLKELGYTPPA